MGTVKEIHCELTPDGRLKHLSDWNKGVAEWLAARESIRLTNAHWELIDVLREYYDMYNTSPILKLLKREIYEKLNKQKAEDDYLASLFPKGILAQGTRIAGIPLPLLDDEIERKPAKATSVQKHIHGSFEFQGKNIAVYEKGNLINLADWSEPLAEHMAKQEGITLTPAHWEVLNFLRSFYFNYGITPMVRLLMKNLNEDLGASKSDSQYLYKLFPGGPSRQGSRIAGLPEPQGCIDE